VQNLSVLDWQPGLLASAGKLINSKETFMMTQDTEWVTEVGEAPAPGLSDTDSPRNTNTQQRMRSGGPSIDGGANAARQARSDGAATDDSARSGIDEAKQYAQDMAGRAKEQGRAMFDEQKDSAAGTVDSAANAFRNTAQQLQGEGNAQTGRYVEMFADQLQSLGDQLRNKNLDTLMRDAENLGRRSPGTFLAGSMIAGFVLARFLKSSADHQHDDSDRSYREPRNRSSSADDAEWRNQAGSRGADYDAGALLSKRSNVSDRGESSFASNAMSDADMSGSVMEGSDVGSSASTSAAGSSPLSGSSTSTSGGTTYVNR
jgi:F0F1-type ATP synthase membrane subunit b/b'